MNTINKINIDETIKTVERLLKEDKSASPQFRAVVKLMIMVINLLLNKLGINSNNSSKPPSQDVSRKRGSKRKTRGQKRKPGGQKGHIGTNLKPESNPNRIIVVEIDRRTIPEGEYTDIGFEARQVIEIEISKKVIEYRAQILQDNYGNEFVADFPKGVIRPVQYGNSIKAQAVYMSQGQLIPYDRVREYFADQCGIPISAGSIFNFNKKAYTLLEGFEDIIKCKLIKEKLLHADETGINIDGKLHWLHTASSKLLTMFYPHPKRGFDAISDMGILENFRGILCHDHWKPYFRLKCTHVLCNAHHIRELERVWEQDGLHWAKKMQELLRKMNKATEKAGGILPEQEAEVFRRKYREILRQGDKECPAPEVAKDKKKRGRIAKTKSRNLLERLRDFETETLRFMTDIDVPFTNNQGENDIRMTKVQQKISGCFRSFEGAEIFCRVRSYLTTCSKHGIAPTTALNLLFSGKLPEFIDNLV